MDKLSLAATLIGYFGTLGGVLAVLHRLWKSVKAEKEGVQCLLRSRIREIYYHHADEPAPAIREYERQDLDDLYAGYKALGGNHFVDDLYEKMRAWKVVK